MKPIELVNTNIGSESEFAFSHGNIYPICSLPFGMNYFTIQTTSQNGPWFYSTSHETFEGFRLTHQPCPWLNDFGHLRFMATSGKYMNSVSKYKNEKSILRPYELSVLLEDFNVDFSLVPSSRGAIMKMESFNKENVNLLLLPYEESNFEINKRTLSGYTDAKSTLPFKKLREYVYGEFNVLPVNVKHIDNCGLFITFKETSAIFRFATSYISLEQAKLNYEREIKNETYQFLKEKAYKAWEDKLSAIEVSDEDIEKVKTFYSCFYRGLLFPTTFFELNKDNKPYHYNADIDKVCNGTFYTNNGFWDTYRTEYPLLSIVFPDLVRDFIEGFINYSEEITWLPKWICPGEVGMMPGALIEAVIADAAVKCIISGDLLKRAYSLLKKNAYEVYGHDWLHGRRFLDDYIKYGYIPYNNHECINNTLDCAYGDFCIAQVAKIVGDEKTYNDLLKRSKNYKNLFDKNVGFMRGKDKEGNFKKEFSAIEWGGDNCEGSYWQNSFAVYHDVDGLASLYGGKDKLIAKLDELFATEPKYEVGYYKAVIHEMSEMAACDFGQCAISNQPSFHIPWLYSMLGEKDKTIHWVKRIIDEAFDCSEKGFPGDEDNGSMSSWYVFACLGFYPVCPGKDEFALSEAQFKTIKINNRLLNKNENRCVISTKDLFE